LRIFVDGIAANGISYFGVGVSFGITLADYAVAFNSYYKLARQY
jgi:hypothetical protein